jgi:hypothetical protein
MQVFLFSVEIAGTFASCLPAIAHRCLGPELEAVGLHFSV